ncbi:MAG: DUF1080 domain-containing protein [Pirellulaceae bacterium]
MRSILLALIILLIQFGDSRAQEPAVSTTDSANAAKAERSQKSASNMEKVEPEKAESPIVAANAEDAPEAAAMPEPAKKVISEVLVPKSDPKLDSKPAKKKLVEEKKPTRLSYTVPPEDNIEYELMGEFVGDVEYEDGSSKTIGLQIRPIGNGDFEALQYVGGVPGQDGFQNASPIRMVGRLSGDFIVLSGGPWAYFAEPQSCLIVDRKGSTRGRLERVARVSPTLGVQPPEGAVVLFDGSGVEQFTSARMTDEGLLMEGADTLPLFQDFNMHVEFRLPYMPTSDGQQRGNSGCYLQSRYELQVLDSFGQLPVFNGCSAIYRQKAPDLNMCLPPLQWQTYDVQFTAPRWGADGSKLRNAHITVWHNGVKTQDNYSIINKTGAGKEEAPTLLPIRFQNHSDPVRYRNIWAVDRGLILPEFPLYPQTAGGLVESDGGSVEADGSNAEAKDEPDAETPPEAGAETKQEGAEEKVEEANAPTSAE